MVARGLLAAMISTLCGCAQAVAPAHEQDLNRERADLEAIARARDGIPEAETLAQSGDLGGARLRLLAALEAAPAGSEAAWDVREALLKLARAAPVEPR